MSPQVPKYNPQNCLSSGHRSWSWKDLPPSPSSSPLPDKRPSSPPPTQPHKKHKKSKAILVDETGNLSTRKPETSQDFDRLLLGSPNSSILWVQYMAHQISIGEIQKARDIGARALETINRYEERERLNVYKALISLEVEFGTGEEVMAYFNRVVQLTDERELYFALAEEFEVKEKFEKAEETYRTMIKKFADDVEVHAKFGLFLFKQDKVDLARELLKTCLKKFDKKNQILTTTKFATMEFKYGEPERARTIFERLVQDNRKRSDIWSVWIDMEKKTGDVKRVRTLFERVTEQSNFSSKVMQFLFNKWMRFEQESGTDEHVEKVKEKALAYVNSKESKATQ